MTDQVDAMYSPWRRAWLYVLAGSVAFFLVAPTIIIIPLSFSDGSLLRFPPTALSLRWYDAFFSSPEWLQATRVSIVTALGTVILATPAGILAAYGVRTSQGRTGEIIVAIVMAPLIVPVVLTGVGLFFSYARLGLNNTLPGLVLAHAMFAVPYVFVTMSSALQNFDLNQQRVARSLGASAARAFLTVTLPQLRLSVLASAFLAFLTSFDEVVIALFISGGQLSTLPKLMFQELRMSLDPTITAVSSLMLSLAVFVLAATQFLSRRERQRLGTAAGPLRQ
ncbi:MAG: ABC transporter permease [Roseiarcus sp.]